MNLQIADKHAGPFATIRATQLNEPEICTARLHQLTDNFVLGSVLGDGEGRSY